MEKIMGFPERDAGRMKNFWGYRGWPWGLQKIFGLSGKNAGFPDADAGPMAILRAHGGNIGFPAQEKTFPGDQTGKGWTSRDPVDTRAHSSH
jgi:hypothetical protein